MNDGDQQDPTDSTEFPPPTSGESTEPAATPPVDDTAPVAATSVDDTAPIAATPVEEPTVTAPAAAAAAPERRKGVLVPVWALATVGSVLLLLVGGIVGYAIGADDGGGNDRVATGVNRSDNALPGIRDFFGQFEGGNGSNGNGENNGNNGGNGNGNNGNGNGNGGNAPSAPSGNGAFLGVAVSDSTDPAGAALVRVVPDSPAAKAGLRTDDVITEVDGQTVADAAALTQRVRSHDVGDDIKVTYRRDGDTKTVTVTLSDRTPTSTQ